MTYGIIYGSPSLTHYMVVCGGGAASATGGGAVWCNLIGSRWQRNPIHIAGGVLSANGGTVADPAANGGGGGSGGSIRLSGKSISNYGTIRAKGAVPPSGGAGGGRIAFNYSTNLVEGSVDGHRSISGNSCLQYSPNG